jgi:DNA recombination protein RmuC
MRATVDEKLQATLEQRLGASFRQVSERLEQVHRGLGEMQSLATGVGDLKRVLTNVKSRGTWGEVQLGALLTDLLQPGQYSQNVATRPGSKERVEYAVKFPGRSDDGAPCWLPIDAKFPLDDWRSCGMRSARRRYRRRCNRGRSTSSSRRPARMIATNTSSATASDFCPGVPPRASSPRRVASQSCHTLQREFRRRWPVRRTSRGDAEQPAAGLRTLAIESSRPGGACSAP